jgi:hypothetical protein
MATAAQQVVQAQQQVELSKLPLFFGDKAKDTFKIETWIIRVEQGKKAAQWNDEQTCAYVYNALRGSALDHWNYMVLSRKNVESWQVIKTELLSTYGTTHTAKSAWVNLRLDQKHGETLMTFVARVVYSVEEFHHLVPCKTQLSNAELTARVPAAGANFPAVA